MSTEKKAEMAITTKNTVDIVAQKVRKFHENGELHFPANYSPENAMKAAWLAIQETKDKSQRPALEVCTRESVANTLLNMVVQGLNPMKKQCYFIVYGNQLTLQRSYFGSMHIAKTVDPNITDIIGEVVYEGQNFRYGKKHGRTYVIEHDMQLGDDEKPMVGAYCQILYKDGTENTTIMSMKEIKKSWSMSRMNPIDANGEIKATSTHGQFTAEMAKKTVINRACKSIINSSGDDSLLTLAYRKTASDIAEAEAQEEIAENANSQPIVVDVETGEVSNTTEPSALHEMIDEDDSEPPTDADFDDLP